MVEVGFGKAAELAKTELIERYKKLLSLRKLLEVYLTEIPGLIIFSQQANRLPNTVQFGISGVDGEMLLMKLDQKKLQFLVALPAPVAQTQLATF